MEKIKFINGKFTPEEAKEVLLDIIARKINFHDLKNLSSQMRYNHPDAGSEERIRELQEAKAQVLALVQEAKEERSDFIIDSTIRIAFVAKEQAKEICSEEEGY